MNKYYFSLNSRKRPHYDCDNKIGIYGIFIENQLVYIGKTKNSFLTRYSTHKSNIKIKKRKLYNKMYEALKANKEVYLLPLRFCSQEDNINQIEKNYIEKYKPILNQEGVTFKYRGI